MHVPAWVSNHNPYELPTPMILPNRDKGESIEEEILFMNFLFLAYKND